jgi:hypothetical protein
VTLVNAETGEVVARCTPDEARHLTERIRDAVGAVWSLLVEAHERQAWAALGYGSWREYATAEFGMSQSHAYRILDQARVIRAIEEATGSPMGEISEREARDVKPRLKAVTDSIKEKVAAEATVEPERVKAIVAEVVAEERDKARQEAEDRAALNEVNDNLRRGGIDLDEEALRQRGQFSRLCRDLSNLPAAADFLDVHRDALLPRHIAQAERAYAWLDDFLLELRGDE